MLLSEMPEPMVRPGPKPEPTTRLLIAVPFYRNERLAPSFVGGLRACAEELEALSARVVLYDDSPDYPALAAAMDAAVEAEPGTLRIDIQRNPENLGWVKTCNLAMQEALRLGADLILFNSDTVIFPGALTEMVRVAQLDPMIGFVNPRSNNATIASFPIGERFRTAAPEAAAAAHKALAHLLPEVSYAPTAVGFAMFIRKTILSEFGFFDEVYGKGYNEENDLVMRASRCGYRAALANRAFVWHEGEQSFEGDARKSVVEQENSALLLRRYPEYSGLVQAWFDGLAYRAELLISQVAPDANGKVRIAFDFSTFGPYHSGTQKVGVQLLESAAKHWRDHFELYVLSPQSVFDFHQLQQYGVERCDPHGPELFAAIFRVGQPFDWDTARRLALKGAAIGVFMLDTISIDCSHLCDQRVVNIWHHTLTNADFIVYNSAFTARQFALRFPDATPPQRISLHSMDFNDYRDELKQDPQISASISALPDDYILLFGNQYPHKAVGDVANRLAETFPETNFVALGVTADGIAVAGSPGGLRHAAGLRDDKLEQRDNLRGFRVGQLSDADIDALKRKAKIIIMPSHYEGFGLPIVHALALGKPIVARRLPPLTEISDALDQPHNLHFFETLDELMAIVRDPPAWRATQSAGVKGDADRAARDVREMIEDAVKRVSYTRIQNRFRDVYVVYSMAPGTPGARPEFAAQRIGQMTERLFRSLFRLPGVFEFTRGLYRVMDTIRRR
jgi:GT2 family glycosyltransferase/glycosyltransferase involved in cell wall biosynthesis